MRRHVPSGRLSGPTLKPPLTFFTRGSCASFSLSLFGILSVILWRFVCWKLFFRRRYREGDTEFCWLSDISGSESGQKCWLPTKVTAPGIDDLASATTLQVNFTTPFFLDTFLGYFYTLKSTSLSTISFLLPVFWEYGLAPKSDSDAEWPWKCPSSRENAPPLLPFGLSTACPQSLSDAITFH